MLTKNEIRARHFKKRNDMSANDVQRLSSIICSKLIQHTKSDRYNRVMCYMAMENEVDLGQFIDYLLADNINICLPKCGAHYSMAAHDIQSLGDTEIGSFGIVEPKNDMPRIEPSDIDLIIVPGLAFDAIGTRLGRGGGYYDRFLDGNIPTIMVAYNWQEVDTLPATGFDVSMNVIITEDRTINL